MDTPTQELRNATVSIKVTPRERTSVAFVAGVKGTDVSNLLRAHSLVDVLAEADRLRAEFGAAAVAA